MLEFFKKPIVSTKCNQDRVLIIQICRFASIIPEEAVHLPRVNFADLLQWRPLAKAATMSRLCGALVQ
jgi:hypothetical protein